MFDRPIKSGSEKFKLLINDYVVNPEICNFKCSYCLSNHSPIWISDFQASGSSSHKLELGIEVENNLNRFDELFEYPILRLSGGEILLYSDIASFVERQSQRYAAVQLITNGSCLTSDIVDKFKGLGNIFIHISLDGHTYEMNSYRVKSQKQHKKLIENVEYAINSGIPIEIGSVLTNINTYSYRSFLDYLNQFDNKAIVYPFPVRGQGMTDFSMKGEDGQLFSEILQSYDMYSELLPPINFMKHVASVINGENRKMRCHLPKISIQSFNTGDLTPCLNLWMNKLGNINRQTLEDIETAISKESIYTVFNQQRPRLKFCKGCLTSLDVISLYLSDEISLEDITKIPLYSADIIKNSLMELKSLLHKGGSIDG